MTKRFKNAIDALVYAFFNDTLAKSECSACAVGNIVAHAFGKKLNPERLDFSVRNDNGTPNDAWGQAFATDWGYQDIVKSKLKDARVLECINSTGYSVLEMAKVEKAFESNTKIRYSAYDNHSKDEIMQDQYKGLMAVVSVLCEIEGIEDPSEYKELFAFQS
ncbi:hypothetical protein [Pedobacter sp.]|uniref:hypothetical protein n=1 Tax=Pedobacter sp. TaxID=1411316 RepID=UPI003C6151AC